MGVDLPQTRTICTTLWPARAGSPTPRRTPLRPAAWTATPSSSCPRPCPCWPARGGCCGCCWCVQPWSPSSVALTWCTVRSNRCRDPTTYEYGGKPANEAGTYVTIHSGSTLVRLPAPSAALGGQGRVQVQALPDPNLTHKSRRFKSALHPCAGHPRSIHGGGGRAAARPVRGAVR